MSKHAEQTFMVVDIDAWRDMEGGWYWNEAWNIDTVHISDEKITPRHVFNLMRENGYLSEASKGKVAMEDDGYAITIMSKSTRKPLLALIYTEKM